MDLIRWDSNRCLICEAIDRAYEILTDPDISSDLTVFLITSLYNEVIHPLLKEMGWGELYDRLPLITLHSSSKKLFNCWKVVRDLQLDFGLV